MIDYDEDWVWLMLFKREGNVAWRATVYTLPACIVAVGLLYLDEWVPGFREDLGMTDITSSMLWAATTGMLSTMVAYRTSRAFSRFWEGTGLLHQMRGEWFDTVSNCVTFSISAKTSKPEEVTAFRHTLIRLMSLCHGNALEEISDYGMRLETIDTFGLDTATLQHLQDCYQKYGFNKVEVMLHLVQSLITDALRRGVLDIPAPILSRVYQTISRGFVNLLNAKKIQDTRFPFPYSQLIYILLALNYFLTPSVITANVNSKILACVFTFVPMFGLWNLNFISIELENPFGTDDNDLPMEHFQQEMNNCLMMLLHPNTDLIANVSSRCVMDFEALQESVMIMTDESHAETCRRFSAGSPSAKDRAMAARRSSQRRLSEFDHKRTNSFLEREADARSSPSSSVVGDLPEANSPRRSSLSASTPRQSETGDGGTSASQGESEDATSVKWTGRDAESVLSTTVLSTPPSRDRLYPLEQHSTRLEAQQGTRLYPLEQYSSGMHVPKSINGQIAMEDEEELTPMSAPGSRLPAFKLAKRATEATEEMIGCVDFLSLEHSMEKMTKSLSCWTLRIENEIDHLHENSAILKDALGSIRRLLPVVSGVATPVVSGSAKR